MVDAVPFWWHSIDLGRGVVTQGHKSSQRLEEELAAYQFPDLKGRTVLDIGAWDGFFSFEAERRGAARVVALDHFVWSIEFGAEYGRQASAAHADAAPELDRATTDVRQSDELPGRRGFDLAHRVLESRVEPVVADFMETDLSELGQFDVVFYLGVLYHIKNPLLALERLAQVTGEMAVIETEAVWYPQLEDHAWCEFFETNELGGDDTNWWAPNARALVGMCRAAGFSKVKLLVTPPRSRWRVDILLRRLRRWLLRRGRGGEVVRRYRLVAHAFK
jgi:tRNA (mo5U34)-methyltransferase